MEKLKLDRILVPQGAEYQAIRRGLRKAGPARPAVVPIPIGGAGLREFLSAWLESPDFLQNPPQRVLLLGLAGSLSPRYSQGDGLIFSECLREKNPQAIQKFALPLTNALHQHLQHQVNWARGLSCDRLVVAAAEKQALGQAYGVDAVEMEGSTVLQMLRSLDVSVAMIRVISDDCTQNLPDLTAAIGVDGSLHLGRLAMKMLQSPQSAFGLIKGSLIGLRKLELLTTLLFSQIDLAVILTKE